MELVYAGIALVAGIVAGIGIYTFIQKQKDEQLKKESEQLIENAKRNSRSIEREAYLKGKEKFQNERAQAQKQLKRREQEMRKNEENARKQDKDLKRREQILRDRENVVRNRQKQFEENKQRVLERETEIEKIVDQQISRLEELSGMNRDDATKELIDRLIDQAKGEAAQYIIDIKKEAQDRARWEAVDIMAFAMERMAAEYTMESTLVSVSLPNDNWKGLIIGREGRNIKSFESATGVKVIVDDTPETVVMSSFDPIKREIARLAMEAMIHKKNINPKAIDSEVVKAEKVVNESIRKAADQTLKELNLKNVHNEMKTYLGRLRYRSSYGQNILQHSKEVAWLAGNMAQELGLDVQLAKRAGLFHDIGKAVSNDSEGSHVTIGVEITTRFNEHPVVINSVLAHHEEAEPISPISVLVTAADRISGARPGARRESLEAYTQRISKLEELANSFEGVAKTYALSAGREIRVIVQPEKLTDLEADMLASDIARKIKDTMEYPGQIKVSVIRHLAVQSTTDEHLNTKKAAG